MGASSILAYGPNHGWVSTRSDKKEAAQAFPKRVENFSKRDIVVYTDGSQIKDGSKTSIGAGWVGFQAARRVLRGCEPLGSPVEVYDAEAQARFKVFQMVSSSWERREQESWTLSGKVYVWWCPGHGGIPGNEEADAQAKGACRQVPEVQPQASLAHIKRKAKAFAFQTFAGRWPSLCPRQYADLEIVPHPKPPELRLPRHLLGKLYEARSQHGDFAAYHERFDHQDALLNCSCGRPKSPVHFYFCKRGRKATPHYLRPKMARTSIDFL